MNKIQIGMVGVGIVLLGIGVWQMMLSSKGDEVMVTDANQAQAAVAVPEALVVDMAGAVEKPGLYKMNGDVRIGDVLVVAGGLSAKADRSYVARFINQAQRVTDGMKIYVPELGEAPGTVSEDGAAGLVAGAMLINVNTATLSQLDALAGVGGVRAQAIIDNRPYGSLEELVVKAKIPQSVIDDNEGKISVY
jgi:competence protein ComEA